MGSFCVREFGEGMEFASGSVITTEIGTGRTSIPLREVSLRRGVWWGCW